MPHRVNTVPASSAPCVGIGWRHPHYAELLERQPELGFLEVHSENFFASGGAALAIPKHFSFFSWAAAGAAMRERDIRVAAVAAIIARWFIFILQTLR